MFKSRDPKKLFGKAGEDYSIHTLQAQGYEIVARNFYTPYGEIDIIAIDGNHLVFIEVKSRTRQTVDETKSSISFRKQQKITKSALYFVCHYENTNIIEYRFDVLILQQEQAGFKVTHLINAFPPAEVGDFFA